MKFSIIFSVLLSITIIAIILFLTVNPNQLAQISKVNIRYEFFIAAVLLNFLSWCLWGLRLKILSNASAPDVKVEWWESTKIVMANLFLAGITPSMAGGEPVRIHLLRKKGMSFGCAIASVLGERVLDAIFFLICVPFALVVIYNPLSSFLLTEDISIDYVLFALSVGIVVFLIVIFLFFYAIFRPIKVKGFVEWLNTKFYRFRKNKEKGIKFVKFINHEIDNFHNSMMMFLKEKKGVFLSAGILTFFQWIVAWLIASMVLFGLGLNHNIVYSMAAQVFLIIIVMMPTTPGSSGVTEVGTWGLYLFIINDALVTNGHPLVGAIGFDQASSLLIGVFVILFRFITYYMNLIVGAIFQYRIFKSVASFSMDMIQKKGDEEKDCKK